MASLCVLLAASRLGAQRAPVLDDFMGYTTCRGGIPVTTLREDVLGSQREQEVRAHEEVHHRQAAAFRTCEAFLASLATARKVIEAEIPAYCAQYRVALARGAEPEDERRDYVLRISAQAGAMENRLDVLQMFERACP